MNYYVIIEIPVMAESDDDAFDIGEAIIEHLAETFNDDESLELDEVLISVRRS